MRAQSSAADPRGGKHMSRNRARHRRGLSTAAGTIAVLLLTACSANTPALSTPTVQQSPRSAPADFTVYDTTFYANLNLEQAGAVKADIIYGSAVASLAGQPSPGGTHGGPKAELALPPRQAYEQLVRQHLSTPGPLVLDYETLYLTGPPDEAQRHFQKLSTLLQWTHQAAPGKQIGFWGLLNNTQPAYYPLARSLAEHEDAFFPDLYTFSPDRNKWQARLDRDLAEAKQINPNVPVYPFLWPQYPEHTPNAGQYLSADLWSYELAACAKTVKGVAIWGGSTRGNRDQTWVDTLKQFTAR
ncbi:hypothetical protein AB0451_33825 [Streptomyces sp. NPDC052000]|uniref:hypothetical protein n=1 Tax=Streptomyces sp. NPDC052000 TaxID=3155676 RepID=UPI003450DE71